MPDIDRFVHTTVEEAPPLAPSRAMRGPLVRPPEAPWGGWTNEGALQELCGRLEGDLSPGATYRVGIVTFPEFDVGRVIAELVGVSLLSVLDEVGRAIEQEPVLEFVVCSPPLPQGCNTGTRATPLSVSPTELFLLTPAQPLDLDPAPDGVVESMPTMPGTECLQ